LGRFFALAYLQPINLQREPVATPLQRDLMEISNAEIGGGLRAALRVGAETVTGNLGQPTGSSMIRSPISRSQIR
jgi:hypothetical protein